MELNVEYFKEVLEKKGWTGRQFAMKSGLSSATISRVLTGKRNAGRKAVKAIKKSLKDEPLENLFYVDDRREKNGN